MLQSGAAYQYLSYGRDSTPTVNFTGILSLWVENTSGATSRKLLRWTNTHGTLGPSLQQDQMELPQHCMLLLWPAQMRTRGRTLGFSMGSATEPHAFEPLPLLLREVPVDLKPKKAWSQNTCLKSCWARGGPLGQSRKPSFMRLGSAFWSSLLGTHLQNPKGQI